MPTFAEAGYPDLVVTSRPTVAALAEALREIVSGMPDASGQCMKAAVGRQTTVSNCGGSKPA